MPKLWRDELMLTDWKHLEPGVTAFRDTGERSRMRLIRDAMVDSENELDDIREAGTRIISEQSEYGLLNDECSRMAAHMDEEWTERYE